MKACFVARIAAGDADAAATTAAANTCTTGVADAKPQSGDCALEEGTPAKYLDNGAPIMMTDLADKFSAECATGALAKTLIESLDSGSDSSDDDDDQGDGETPSPVVVADPCAGVACGDNGSCAAGKCVCTGGFTGANCETAPVAPPVTAKTQ